MTSGAWTGGYVRRTLGVRIHTDRRRSLIPVETLVGLALRRNPKRAHLLVSRVLAKHLPTDPAVSSAAGEVLGALVSARLSASPEESAAVDDIVRQLASVLGTDNPSPASVERLRRTVRSMKTSRPDIVTIGYAETATALGQLVAETIGSYYVHSTRHAVDGAPAAAAFEEGHSHATSHRLVPTDGDWLRAGGTVVLVDDELSTGSTVINTIRELQSRVPQAGYLVATLVDLRTATDRAAFIAVAAELDTTISVVSLATGTIELPVDLLARAHTLVAALPVPVDRAPRSGIVDVVTVGPGVVDPIRSARFGVRPDGAAGASAAIVGQLRRTLAHGPGSAPGQRILVLGTEEFMSLPLSVADQLHRCTAAADARSAGTVTFSTTTRSPIAALDQADYAVASTLRFRSHDAAADGPGDRYAHNLTRDGRRFDCIVLMPEPGTVVSALTGPDSVTEALRGVCDRVVVVLLPAFIPAVSDWTPRTMTSLPGLPAPLTGPDFGSYAPDDVKWLLQDLGAAALEAPAGERERAIQTGQANYAESLPIEYTPTAEYRSLYRESLERSSRRVAEAVGIVTELALAARGDEPVFVSLARAGTPVGILMRRWAREHHGYDAPHYTISIVRGVGVDTTALRYLAAHHDPARIVFVDGWTGKGAIARELSAALTLFAQTDGVLFGDDLAVLADPGHCVSLYGTRQDYLIPSACLNSTVSGLVSRTVYNRRLIGPGEFHGAKFYSSLAPNDVSLEFLDAVSVHFPDVAAAVGLGVAEAVSVDRRPTWLGWAAVERIGSDYGIDNLNLIKPGVGETTRVLLRRVPWRVLVRPDARQDLAHVLLLAEQRGVPVEEVPGLPYSCVGLIRPVGGPGTTGPGTSFSVPRAARMTP